MENEKGEKEIEESSFMVELLRHKLRNAEYRKILLQNQIFQMKQEERIKAVLERR